MNENHVLLAKQSAALFVPRIRAAGFNSYAEYLRSDHWIFVREMYKTSGRPRKCFHCDDPRYQLHHVSYVRLGHENIDDVLPLCGACHVTLHCAEDPRTPYEMFMIVRFFFPKLGKKDRKRKVSQFTNRNLGRKWSKFKNSGPLIEGTPAVSEYLERIAEGIKKPWNPKPQRHIEPLPLTPGAESIQTLIRQMNDDRKPAQPRNLDADRAKKEN